MGKKLKALSGGLVVALVIVLTVLGGGHQAEAASRNSFSQLPHTTAPFSAGATTTAYQQQQLNELNEFRQAMGLPPVVLDASLTQKIQVGAAVADSIGYLGHYLTDAHRARAAFIPQADWDTAKAALQESLMTSGTDDNIRTLINDNDGSEANQGTGHRAWLMSPSLTRIGVGASLNIDGTYVVAGNDPNNIETEFPKSGSFPAKWALGDGEPVTPLWGVYTTKWYTISTSLPAKVTLTNTTTGQSGTTDGYSSSVTGASFSAITYSPRNLGVRLASGDSYKVSVKEHRNDGSVAYARDYSFTLTGYSDKSHSGGGSTSTVQKGTVNVKALDANGAEISGFGQTLTGDIGKQLTVSAPTIPGYKLTSSSSGSVTYDAQVQTIIFRYAKTDGSGTSTDNTNKPTTDQGQQSAVYPLVAKVWKGAALYTQKSGQQTATGRTLPAGSRWKVFDAYKDSNGTIWYNVGGWIKANDVLNAGPLAKRRVTAKAITTVTASNATLYSPIDGKQFATNRTLPRGSSWKTFEAYQDEAGTIWYNVGGWVKSTETSNHDAQTANHPAIVKINYVPGYGIRLWTESGDFLKITARTLPHGSRWHVFGAKQFGGKIFYNVGGKEWIDAGYTVRG